LDQYFLSFPYFRLSLFHQLHQNQLVL
jgi:hypothetical protein